MSGVYVHTFVTRTEYGDSALRERIWERLDTELRSVAREQGQEIDTEIRHRVSCYITFRDDIAGLIMVGTLERRGDWTVAQLMSSAQAARAKRPPTSTNG